MPKVSRYVFMGSWVTFWLFAVTIIGIPLAILYLLNGTIRIEEDMDDPDAFVEFYRSGKWRKG